jgi:putative membrane protein
VKLFSKLEGAQFDREFLRYQVMHHEKDVAAFNLQAKEGQDPDLKAFAAKQLPVLKEHLQQARDLATQHATGKGTEATGQRGTR